MPRVHRDLANSLCIRGMATARSLVNKVVFPTFQKVGYQSPLVGGCMTHDIMMEGYHRRNGRESLSTLSCIFLELRDINPELSFNVI